MVQSCILCECKWFEQSIYNEHQKFKYSEPKNLPKGEIGGFAFSPDSKKFAFTMNSSFSPGDVFVYSLKDQKAEQWTFSEVGGLNTSKFIEPVLIQYPTFDSVAGKPRMIPAYYYKPKGNGPFPVVINFHGGPEGQFRPGFASYFQFLLNELGVAVIAPNVRGSEGYGKTFLDLDNGFLRENSVKDGGALLDWIAKQPELDAKRICVYGGSYGGYMVLAMMTHYNERLAAGIDVVVYKFCNVFGKHK
jgi:dipeptidyl aminopeptidase/acylaminoacyl peptidase